MKSRKEFLQETTEFRLTHAGRAIALLWYYRQTQEYDERSASGLASDLLDEGFPKPHVTKLHDQLRRSKFVVRGRRPKTFQLDARRIGELDDRYSKIINIKKVIVSSAIIPEEWFVGTRSYLERMVFQINGTYEYGFYDACAVLCRRLMESLIIEVYVSSKRQAEIQDNGLFKRLESLIAYVKADKAVTPSRNAPKTMTEIKLLGDTAAHDRVCITEQVDIDDVKARYRRLVKEIGTLAGILK